MVESAAQVEQCIQDAADINKAFEEQMKIQLEAAFSESEEEAMAEPVS